MESKNIKKYVLLGIAMIVVPGSSILMVGYGIKKFWENRKARHVPTKNP